MNKKLLFSNCRTILSKNLLYLCHIWKMCS